MGETTASDVWKFRRKVVISIMAGKQTDTEGTVALGRRRGKLPAAIEIDAVFETFPPERTRGDKDEFRYEMLNRSAACQAAAAHPEILRAVEPLLGDGLFISDGKTWRSRRPAIAAVVHQSKIDLFAPIIVETASEMVERWNKLRPGQPVDRAHLRPA